MENTISIEEIRDIVKKETSKIIKIYPDFRKKNGVRYSFELIIRMIMASIINGIIEVNKMKDFISSEKIKQYLEDLPHGGKIPKIGCLRIVILKLPSDLLFKLNTDIDAIKEVKNIEEEIQDKKTDLTLKQEGCPNATLNSEIGEIKNIEEQKTNITLEQEMLQNANNVVKQEINICPYIENKQDNILLNLEEKIIAISEISEEKINPFNGKAVAFDGKAVRSGHLQDHKPLMYLNGVCHDTGMTFIQAIVDKKTNEIPVFKQMTRLVDLAGYLCTLDALHTQTQTAKYLYEEKKAHYLFTVKENQKKLLNMIKAEELITSNFDFETVEKGHGRIETRRIWVKDAPISIEKKFPHAKQIMVIERTSEHLSGGKIIKTTQELCYCVTSLLSEQASPEELLKYIREHWTIENKLHYVLDVTFNEDKCRCYKPEMVSGLTMLRKIAINMHRSLGETNIAAGIRKVNFA